MSSMRKIARELNISPSTVSRSFDPESKISDETRNKVLEYAKKIGYQPNTFASTGKTHRRKIIGVIVPHISNMLYLDLLTEMEKALTRYGYRMLVSYAQYGVITDRECLSLMASLQFDSIIYLEPLYGLPDLELIKSISETTRVFYLFPQKSHIIDSVSSITIDDTEGIAKGIEYLIRRGHRKILYLGVDERRRGVYSAAKEMNVSTRDITMIDGLYVDPQQISYTIETRKPTVVMTVARNIEPAVEAISKLGLSIPNDISVISYNDTHLTQILGITSIAYELKKISSSLTEMILQSEREKEAYLPRHLVLDTFICERNSVKKL